MPKMKTKSGAKKRFKVTGTGKVLDAQSRKRHGKIKRTKKQIRQLRGTNVLFKTDGDNIKKSFLPNGCPPPSPPPQAGEDEEGARSARPIRVIEQEICHGTRKTRRHRPCQAQEGAQGRQGLLRPPQEHDPGRQAGGREGQSVRLSRP